MSLEKKVLFIQSTVDQKFRLILNTEWTAKSLNYREKIRNCLATQFSAHFSRQQLALLNDLNWRPEASDGFISISHCSLLGGFAFSKFKVGFDVEETARVSQDILKRVSSEAELSECPQTEFLWVAKEAGFKALSATYQKSQQVVQQVTQQNTQQNLVMTDFLCYDWQSYYENQVFGFRLKSEKTLDFGLNKGFIFPDEHCLFGLFFK